MYFNYHWVGENKEINIGTINLEKVTDIKYIPQTDGEGRHMLIALVYTDRMVTNEEGKLVPYAYTIFHGMDVQRLIQATSAKDKTSYKVPAPRDENNKPIRDDKGKVIKGYTVKSDYTMDRLYQQMNDINTANRLHQESLNEEEE